MKKTVSLLLTAVLILSLMTVGASAAAPEQTADDGYNCYCHYPVNLHVPGLPKTIRATFGYDRDFIDVVPDYPDQEGYPSYNADGIAFPLATAEYGDFYNVSYTVDDTVISYEYTLKDGVTLDDYIDILQAKGLSFSRIAGHKNLFCLFDIAMKNKTADAAPAVECKILDVMTDDATVLYRDGECVGNAHFQCLPFPLPNLDAVADPTEEPQPIEGEYLDQLLEQYNLDRSQLTAYSEIYTHTDENGAADWAIVRAATEVQRSSLYTSPRYFEFGNRVLDIEDAGEPFIFNIGVYSVKHRRFFDISTPALYELTDIDKVWTELGEGRLIGDMNGDNALEIDDATIIRRCDAGMMDYPDNDKNTPTCNAENAIPYFSDFDQDGERTIMDATAIQRFLIDLPYHCAGWTPYPHHGDVDPLPTEPVTEPETVAPTEPATEPIDPSVPRITGFKSTGRGVELTLSTVPGAEKYRVFYKNKAGEWKSMGETTGSTFLDNDVKVGTTYTYTVRCIKADLSDYTSDFNRDGWKYTYDPRLDTPKITKVEAVADGVEIHWAPVEGAELYRVYYNGSKGWTKMADVSTTSYVDTDVSPGHTYTYTVRCLSQGGKDFASDYDHDGTRFYLAPNPEIGSIMVYMDRIEVYTEAKDARFRLYRKEGSSGWKRIAEIDWDESNTYKDYDVVPGKTYTYTARFVDEDGTFLSYYNTTGWKVTYKASECIPELEYFVYYGDDTALVKAKDDNKLGLKKFYLHTTTYEGEYIGTFEITDEPTYLSGDFFEAQKRYKFFMEGIDSSGNVITKWNEIVVKTMSMPSNLKIQKTGERQYRLTWRKDTYFTECCGLSVYTAEGERVIDSRQLWYSDYTIDLSAYPENKQWICLVWMEDQKEINYSDSAYLEFNEEDFE